ncbi:MAG: dihydrolipoyl dehydrogenase [Deltaproteobacteria bacterium]|nr:dihydrolipoyl dehydrogenase [Deltaproteobacteria bacterium]
MSQRIEVDVAVIGAGTAGLAAYRAAAAVTPRAVVIEAGPHGTTCARVGCMPSKLLIAAAEAAEHARTAAPFGVTAEVTIDGKAVMDRVRRERDRFVGFVLEGVEKIPDEHKLHGRARIVAPGKLEVALTSGGTAEITARSIVIATGSSPFVPAVFEGLKGRLVLNDDVFQWESLPKSVVVFGAGVIGLELGQALARLGVRVRVFGKSGTLGGITDPVVKQAALEAFRRELVIDTDAKVHEVVKGGDGVVVRFDDLDGNERSETFEYALVAAGRKANLEGLGIENAGLELDSRGVPRFDRTTLLARAATSPSGKAVVPVFLAGDVNDDVPLLHEAADEGRIAGENAARFPNVKPGLRRSLLAITFSEPQLSIVGASYQTLTSVDGKKEGVDFVTGTIDFTDQGRSRVMLQNHGKARVYADAKTGRFLGAELAGPRVEHIGHLLAWAHQQELGIAEMLQMPFYHPVVEEGLRTALRDANAKLAQKKEEKTK